MAELLPEVSPLEILEQRQLVERLQTDHASDKVRPKGTCRVQIPVSPRFCSCPGSFDFSIPPSLRVTLPRTDSLTQFENLTW
jgi:hypothetical protein